MGKESVNAYHGILLTFGGMLVTVGGQLLTVEGVLVTVDAGGMLARILGRDEKNFLYFI